MNFPKKTLVTVLIICVAIAIFFIWKTLGVVMKTQETPLISLTSNEIKQEETTVENPPQSVDNPIPVNQSVKNVLVKDSGAIDPLAFAQWRPKNLFEDANDPRELVQASLENVSVNQETLIPEGTYGIAFIFKGENNTYILASLFEQLRGYVDPRFPEKPGLAKNLAYHGWLLRTKGETTEILDTGEFIHGYDGGPQNWYPTTTDLTTYSQYQVTLSPLGSKEPTEGIVIFKGSLQLKNK